jgi:hypothetical protein
MALNLIEDNGTNLSLTLGGHEISRRYVDTSGQSMTTPMYVSGNKLRRTRYHRLLAESVMGGAWNLTHSSFVYNHQDLQVDPNVEPFEDKQAALTYMKQFKPPVEVTVIDD